MILKTKENIKKNGITSAEACIMLLSNLAGIDKSLADTMFQDTGLKNMNENTFKANRKKMENHLNSLFARSITVLEFQEMLQGEIDRTSVSYSTIKP